MPTRVSNITRNTNETKIQLSLNLDGTGISSVATGIGFFDHMLECFSKHGFFDLTLKVEGDLQVDSHHTIEDTGIALGTAIKDALSDKTGLKRYGNSILPMDDSLVLSAIDLCGRPYLSFDYSFKKNTIGYLDTEMIREFFYAISYSAGMNLHIKVFSGENTHHIIEAMFKSFAKALYDATKIDKRICGVLITTGTL